MNYTIETIADFQPDRFVGCRKFCLDMIKFYYGIDYRPDYHADLDSLLEGPSQNWFSKENGGEFWAATTSDTILATIGIYSLTKKPITQTRLANYYGKQKVCHLVRAYVLPHLQGNGIGTELVARAEMKAAELGYDVVYLHADSNNNPTLNFWNKRGFEKFTHKSEPEYIDFKKTPLKNPTNI